MRGITLRRHYFFSPSTTARLGGELAGPDAWDALRIGDAEPDFAMAATRERWENDCGQPLLIERGRRIAALADGVGATGVASFGTGTGCIEYQLHRAAPELALHLSDFSPETVARLGQVFPEAASAQVLDLLGGGLPSHPGAIALLHRIDSEFTDEQLRTVFGRLRAAEYRYVAIVPTMLLTPRIAVAELARRATALLKRRRATFVGFARTRRSFEAIWGGPYSVRLQEQAGGAPLILLEAE